MTPAQLKKAVKEGKIDDESHLKGFTPVRYVYFGRKEGTNVHDGVVSVGYTISDDGKLLRIAIAFCSPEDIFSKKKTQAIIHGRIAWSKTEDIEAEDKLFSDMRYEEIIEIIKFNVNGTFNSVVMDINGEQTYTTIGEYVKAHLFADYPSFAEVNFPWWFKGI